MKLLIYCAVFLLCNFQLLAIQKDTTEGRNKKLPPKAKVAKNKTLYTPNSIEDYKDPYYKLDYLNRNIGLPPTKYNLSTPQATLEHFIFNAKNEKFKEAAYVLNLNLYPENLSIEQASKLAEKFYFVLDQRASINWGSIPDRPDGQISSSSSTNKAVAGKPQRSIIFGKLDLNGRGVSLQMQRVKLKNQGALWMISANTAENIDELYATYGPRELDRAMPDWARLNFWGMPSGSLSGPSFWPLFVIISAG